MTQKIWEVADGLGVDRKEFLSFVKSQGYNVKTTSKGLSDEEAEALTVAWKKSSTPPLKIARALSIVSPDSPRGKKIRGKKMEYIPHVRRISQKNVNRLVYGFFGLFILLNVGMAFSNFASKAGYQRETKKLAQTYSSSALHAKPASVDFKAIYFLDGFVNTYFNYPSDPVGQNKVVAQLGLYYGQQLPLASQGMSKIASTLHDYQLLSMTSKEASYSVSYETNGKITNTIFVIPYAKVGARYYVSSYPTFENPAKLNAGTKAPEINLNAVSSVSGTKKKSLDSFVKTLFQAKTTSAQSLSLVSKGLSVSTNEKLDSVDYTYYQKLKGNRYKAVVQAKFSNALGTHPEDYVFIVTKTKESYFASDFSNVITPADVAQKNE